MVLKTEIYSAAQYSRSSAFVLRKRPPNPLEICPRPHRDLYMDLADPSWQLIGRFIERTFNTNIMTKPIQSKINAYL